MAINRAKITVLGPVKLGDPAIVTHGGAGGWRGVSSFAEVAAAVEDAAAAGLRSASLTPLDMVEASIVVLEDSGVLNAGLGSVLTIDGRVVMDAGLMDDGLKAGGVAAVSYPRNPIRLARWVAEHLDHVLIAGQEADRLAAALGLERHPGPSKRSLELWRRLRRELESNGRGPSWAKRLLDLGLYTGGDTVGAVVLSSGRLAAGTSTGGIALKHPGRVGDSPIPGAGFHVEKGVGACAATGIGETIILGRPCIYALNLLSDGLPVDEAARAAVTRHSSMFGSDNLGLILVDVKGYAAAAMNTAAMPVGLAGSEAAARGLVLQRKDKEAPSPAAPGRA